jgi:hypothetical protein
MAILKLRRNGKHGAPPAPEVPEQVREALAREQRRARGEWVNPEFDDMYQHILRKYRQMQRYHQVG